jgi:hypothetical protein
VTYGRSGSTLLAGYLSNLPGIDLKGENYLFPIPLAQAESALARAVARPQRNQHLPTKPWYGSHELDLDRWRSDVRRALLNQLYPSTRIPKTLGFKEVRWWELLQDSGLPEVLEWLLEVRPPGALVFLTRRLDDVLASAWWSELGPEERAEARQGLERFEAAMARFADTHPESCVHVTYEDFCAGPETAERLCAFLGVAFDPQVYADTLATRYSYRA